MMLRFSLALLLTLSTAAYADVIDPGEDACSGAQEGAECMVVGGISGTCQPAECCRNDYSNGTPPETVCEDCLKCTPNGATGGTAAEEPQGGNANPAPAGGTAAPETPNGGVAASGGSPTTAPSSGGGSSESTPPASSGDDDSGCSASDSSAQNWGFLSLCIGFFLVARLRRTRD